MSSSSEEISSNQPRVFVLVDFQHLVRVERELVLVFQLFVFVFPAVKVGFDVAELFARGEESRPVRSWFWFEENQVDGFIRDGEFMRDLVGKNGVVKFQFDGVRVLFTSSFARERRTEALVVDDRCRRGFFFLFLLLLLQTPVFSTSPRLFPSNNRRSSKSFLLFFFFSAHV